MPDHTVLIERVFDAVKTFLSKKLEPLEARLSIVERDVGFLEGTSVSRLAHALDEVGKTDARVTELFETVKALPVSQGPPGERGEQGLPGEPGKDGEPGQQGEKGDSGDRGEQGIQGVAGKDGAPGEVGQKGIDGVAGKDGEPGPQGIQGIAGKDGAPGEMGQKGVDGINGRDGIAGVKGDDGEPGRDAWQIPILESIDPARKYARGTCAKHRGGLVSAVRTTDPIGDGDIQAAGWTVVLDGIADFKIIETDDLRTLGFSITTTSGAKSEIVKTFPVVLYRGVFKLGETYSCGDQVTWGGSSWIAIRDGATMKPGEGHSEWQLSVKRGNDGKDGAQGKQGETGRPGMDLTPLTRY